MAVFAFLGPLKIPKILGLFENTRLKMMLTFIPEYYIMYMYFRKLLLCIKALQGVQNYKKGQTSSFRKLSVFYFIKIKKEESMKTGEKVFALWKNGIASIAYNEVEQYFVIHLKV